jgi:hypothetical protein
MDECAIGVKYVQFGRLLAYAYGPRDVCGTCRHSCMAVLGCKMSTSGTQGLGFPVECTSDQAKWRYTTDVCVRQAVCRRRLDSGHSRASCRQINTGKCLDPTGPTSYQHYSCNLPLQVYLAFWVSAPHKSGAITNNLNMPGFNSEMYYSMIKISAETNGPSASWQHPVLPFGR